MLATIEAAAELAPLHNPPNLQGIHAATAIFPGAAQVAVFDTAFHATMPPDAYMYALPYELYERYGMRRYGFHGTSHAFLASRTARALGKPQSELAAVLCHLGAGASMCAVQGGRSVDTTMGMTPLEGLMMATRCGARRRWSEPKHARQGAARVCVTPGSDAARCSAHAQATSTPPSCPSSWRKSS